MPAELDEIHDALCNLKRSFEKGRDRASRERLKSVEEEIKELKVKAYYARTMEKEKK